MGPVGRQVRPAGLGRTVLMDEAYDALLALILDEGLEPGTPAHRQHRQGLGRLADAAA